MACEATAIITRQPPLPDAMIRLLDGSANEGLTTLSQILKRGTVHFRPAMDKSAIATG